MIDYLKGKLVEKSPTHAIVECAEIGVFRKHFSNHLWPSARYGDLPNLDALYSQRRCPSFIWICR